jgi:hypothetical protein
MRANHLDHYKDLDGGFRIWQAPANIDDTDASHIVPPIDPDGLGLGATPYSDHYIQITIANNEFRPAAPTPPPTTPLTPTPAVSTLRPGDMLLPLGIGPEEMPFVNQGGTPTPVADLEVRWTTLGEALALAMGYQTNSAPGGVNDSTSVYTPINGGTRMVLDRANLRLDDYIPYISTNPANPPVFDPANCERIGNQIPLALNILDTFTISPTLSVTDSSNAQKLLIMPQTLTHGGRGKLNINTVPLNTLRPAMDMLSPPSAMDLSNRQWWWWTADPVTLAAPPLDERTDVSPTVIAYRDKGTAFMRPGSYFGASATIDSVYFPDSTTPEALALDGRTAWTHIGQVPGATTIALSPLHEQPGFRTIGELMNVRYRDASGDNTYRCNMDWLEYDNLPPAPGVPAGTPGSQTLYRAGASGHVGVDSVLFATTGNPDHPSAVPNNYTEQLAILNGVLNNVTNRSDVFIAWFQVQGYQQSDVENLGPNDPMVPSVNRRFVMVLDRSKVTKRGQKAEILLFKEVPVDPEPR